jgi:hypothetical protein
MNLEYALTLKSESYPPFLGNPGWAKHIEVPRANLVL